MIFTFVLRLVLLAAGLLFAASLLLAALLFMAVWGLRAMWARLTGRPVMPFVMRVDPRSGFSQVFSARRGMYPFGARGPAAPAREGRPADVVDVEVKRVRD